MKNTLNDVHNHLMMALEDLDTADTPEDLAMAIEKARHKSIVSKAITNNAKLMLDAAKFSVSKGEETPSIFIDKPQKATDS